MKKLSVKQRDVLLETLKERFEINMKRHKGIEWSDVQSRLNSSGKLWSLYEMEGTGGEPDVIGQDNKSGELIFVDCSAQSPTERRSLCFDQAALDSRKQNKPKGSAMEMAARWEVELLSENEYRDLQKLGSFDTTTSSWIQTPAKIRQLGGALYGDRRYDTIFVYHNGAESYYAARGFRCIVRI